MALQKALVPVDIVAGLDTKTDAKNAVEQAYTHLKTKDVFKDMVDA